MTEVHRLTCEEALRLLAAYIDGELSAETRLDVHGHLDACRSCCSRAEFERGLKAQLAALGVTQVRPDLENRVRRLISEFAIVPAPDANNE